MKLFVNRSIRAAWVLSWPAWIITAIVIGITLGSDYEGPWMLLLLGFFLFSLSPLFIAMAILGSALVAVGFVSASAGLKQITRWVWFTPGESE